MDKEKFINLQDALCYLKENNYTFYSAFDVLQKEREVVIKTNIIYKTLIIKYECEIFKRLYICECGFDASINTTIKSAISIGQFINIEYYNGGNVCELR